MLGVGHVVTTSVGMCDIDIRPVIIKDLTASLISCRNWLLSPLDGANESNESGGQFQSNVNTTHCDL